MDGKFELLWQKPQAPKTKAPPGRGFRKRQSADRYLAGAVDDSVVDFLLCLLLLWLFL